MPQSSARRRRTQAERVAESERRLLEAAAALIAERGFERTTTAEICERAGLSNSMVHMRYGSKEALLESLLSSYEDSLLGNLNAEDDRTGLEALVGQADVVREQHRENPQFMRAFFMIVFETVGAIPQLKPWLIAWLDRYIDHIAGIIRNGQADGTIRADLDPVDEANFFMDAGTGPLYRWALNPDRVDLDTELAGWARRMSSWFAA